ncbi:MAG: alpha/beta hydrolase [Leucobacter sp.]
MSPDLEIDAAATLWSHPPEKRAGEPTLVLLHGYGADEHDLFGLAEHLPERFAVASVAAPLAAPNPMPGRSWYPIEGLAERDPAAISAAGEALLAWIDAALPHVDNLYLLGFSQGAAVALQALRLSPARFRAIIALSGYAADGELPGDATLRETKPRVFWGRGSHDQIIPPHQIAHTAIWLPDHADTTVQVYAGLGHGVSEEELRDINRFLEESLGS